MFAPVPENKSRRLCQTCIDSVCRSGHAMAQHFQKRSANAFLSSVNTVGIKYAAASCRRPHSSCTLYQLLHHLSQSPTTLVSCVGHFYGSPLH